MTEKKEGENRVVSLPMGRFNEAPIAHMRWAVTLPHTHNLDDLLSPAYWANNTRRMRKGNIIEVRAEDLSFYAEYICIEVAPSFAIVKQLSYHELDVVDKKTGSLSNNTYVYKWMGPTWGHCVMRKEDHEIVERNLGSKAAVQQWIEKRKKKEEAQEAA